MGKSKQNIKLKSKNRNKRRQKTKKSFHEKKYKIKHGGGDPILPEDIMYQDDLVCILKPNVKKGILVFSHYTKPKEMASLCDIGLKTGQLLKEEGVEFGRDVYHPYIFFRAPFFSREIDYSTIKTEIISSFGEVKIDSLVFIRVDPDKTFVFSSEIRPLYRPPRNGEYDLAMVSELDKSKKTLSEYLSIIRTNKITKQDRERQRDVFWNLHTSQANSYIRGRLNAKYPEFNYDIISRFSEILVSIPHLTPDYFVLCA
jgi:hypothetical protein